jgi:aryl-alcohol dehydrogenase-like predicted oxidoreductase
VEHLEENARAAELEFSPKDREALAAALPGFRAAGLRYPEPLMRTIDTQ